VPPCPPVSYAYALSYPWKSVGRGSVVTVTNSRLTTVYWTSRLFTGERSAILTQVALGIDAGDGYTADVVLLGQVDRPPLTSRCPPCTRCRRIVVVHGGRRWRQVSAHLTCVPAQRQVVCNPSHTELYSPIQRQYSFKKNANTQET